MEADFINVYISKQKALIDDLLAKNIMLETKLAVAESVAGRHKEDGDRVNIEIEEKNKYINRLVDQVNKLQNAQNQREESKLKKKKDQPSAEENIVAEEF